MEGRGSPSALSVVVPAFNAAWCIDRCLAALLAEQRVVPMEVIVVDDGSTDVTGKILESYESRVVVLRQPNAGPGTARNAGIQAS